jgi:menaquinone-dependent protoporphyrinogen IX oxidase
MNGIIVYQGKYGSTKQYAEWIGEDLKLTAVPVDRFKSSTLDEYDTVILGSAVNVGKLVMAGWIANHWETLKTKRVILFSVSGTDPTNKPAIAKIMDASLPPDIRGDIAYFPLHGRFLMKNLPFLMRTILQFVMKAEKDPAKKQMFAEFDDVKREYIAPLVAQTKRAR